MKRFFAVLTVAALAFAVGGVAFAAPKPLVFGLAVHENPSVDVFWGVVVKGAKDAAATYKVTLKFGGSNQPLEQAQLIENYVAAKVDGIIVDLSFGDALKDAVKKAVNAGIPVISINSGVDKYKEFGAMAHVGQTEKVAGNGAGEQFNKAGVKKLLVVFHEEGNVGLEARADGAAETFQGEIARFNVATTGVRDVAGTVAAIQDKLIQDKSIDGILTLNTVIAEAALDAVKAVHGSQKIATFDLSADVLDSIAKGNIMFAIDQQEYLQGYLPIAMLYLYKTNLNTIGGGLPILTGPGIVDKSNAAQVRSLAKQGTR